MDLYAHKSLRVVRMTENARLPERKSIGAAGFDLYSTESVVIPTGKNTCVSTGLKMHIPNGYYGQIASRSSFVLKGIGVQAGVIDSDYRGEVKVVLYNYGQNDMWLESGERIAQLILIAIGTTDVLEVETLDHTDRGNGGFGSTGKK